MSNQQHPSLASIKAITFDLDDTFWDCEPVILSAEETLYQWMHQHTPHVTNENSTEQLREHRMGMYTRFPELATDVTAMRKKALTEIFERYGYGTSKVEDAFAVFYKARSQVVLYEGVVELLKDLSARYALAAITNGNADLDLIGIADYFDDIQCASLTNPPKPEPDMFLKSAAVMGVSVSQILHVGDNPQTDVVGGLNAGTQTVWFNQMQATWPEKLPRAHFEVRSIAELKELIGTSS